MLTKKKFKDFFKNIAALNKSQAISLAFCCFVSYGKSKMLAPAWVSKMLAPAWVSKMLAPAWVSKMLAPAWGLLVLLLIARARCPRQLGDFFNKNIAALNKSQATSLAFCCFVSYGTSKMLAPAWVIVAKYPMHWIPSIYFSTL